MLYNYTFLLQLLHATGMSDLYPFIGLLILHVVISGSSLILHKVFEKQEKTATDTTQNDGVMKKEDIVLKVDIRGMYAIFCRSFCPFPLVIVLSSYCKFAD